MKNAFVIVHHFPSGTKAQYDAAIAAVHPSRDKLPEGQIYHYAGPSAGGWTIVAIHDSEASWVRFRDQILKPAFEKGIPGSFPTSAQEIAFNADTVLP